MTFLCKKDLTAAPYTTHVPAILKQRIEMPLFALISHFFLGKAFDSRVELLDTK